MTQPPTKKTAPVPGAPLTPPGHQPGTGGGSYEQAIRQHTAQLLRGQEKLGQRHQEVLQAIRSTGCRFQTGTASVGGGGGIKIDANLGGGGALTSSTPTPGFQIEREQKEATIRIRWASIKKITVRGFWVLVIGFLVTVGIMVAQWIYSVQQEGAGSSPTGSVTGSPASVGCPSCSDDCGCEEARTALERTRLELIALRHTAWFRMSDTERERINTAIESTERALGALGDSDDATD